MRPDRFPRPPRRAWLSLAVLLALGAAACGDSSKVGEGLEAKKGEKGGADCRLGECVTSTTGGPTTTAPATTTTVRPTTTVKAATTTTAPKAAMFVIKVQNDSTSGGQFSPRLAVVRKGTVVRWTNTDTVARSVEADEGRFKSPSIPPGGSYDYVADTPGDFNYHDGTRPYAVGTLQVK